MINTVLPKNLKSICNDVSSTSEGLNVSPYYTKCLNAPLPPPHTHTHTHTPHPASIFCSRHIYTKNVQQKIIAYQRHIVRVSTRISIPRVLRCIKFTQSAFLGRTSGVFATFVWRTCVHLRFYFRIYGVSVRMCYVRITNV